MASTKTIGHAGRVVLYAMAPVATAALVGWTIANPGANEPLFVQTTYYALLALVLIYAGVRLQRVDVDSLRVWAREHALGIAAALVVGLVAVAAVDPALRILADEANLVGTSKHLYFHRAADFPIAGKWYYDTYWTLTSVTDRRPALYPFLVSLVHVVGGYRVENAFYVNAMVLVVLVFASYRLAKSLGGEVFGLATALLIGAQPNVLVAARSAGFDLLATCMLVVVCQSFVEASRQPSSRRVAIVVLNLCLLANVRYEGWALLVLGVVLLVATRILKRTELRGYGWLYSIMPLLLLPRYWQTVAKASDQEQPLSASLFGLGHFWNNWGEYLGLLRQPLATEAPHAPFVIALAIAGALTLAVQGGFVLRSRQATWHGARVALFVAGFVGAQVVICFSYFWGHPLHPASARLFLWLDVTTAFGAGWLLATAGRLVPVEVAALGRRTTGLLPLFVATALFAMAVPAAQEARFIHSLGLTRQSAEAWRYFSSLGTRRILVLTDRPGLFTIYDYGAMNIVDAPRSLLYELSRHLYEDIYLVQEVDLATHRPQKKFDPWPDVATQAVLEFQNTADTSVRIARVVHPDATGAKATRGAPSR